MATYFVTHDIKVLLISKRYLGTVSQTVAIIKCAFSRMQSYHQNGVIKCVEYIPSEEAQLARGNFPDFRCSMPHN